VTPPPPPPDPALPGAAPVDAAAETAVAPPPDAWPTIKKKPGTKKRPPHANPNTTKSQPPIDLTKVGHAVSQRYGSLLTQAEVYLRARRLIHYG
jgi:hypothetical protein